MGVRKVNDLDDANAFVAGVRNSWCTTLPGFARPNRIELVQFIDRRAAAAIRTVDAARN